MTQEYNKDTHSKVGMFKEKGLWYLVVDETCIPIHALFRLERELSEQVQESPFAETIKYIMAEDIAQELARVLSDQKDKEAKAKAQNNSDKGLN